MELVTLEPGNYDAIVTTVTEGRVGFRLTEPEVMVEFLLESGDPRRLQLEEIAEGARPEGIQVVLNLGVFGSLLNIW